MKCSCRILCLLLGRGGVWAGAVQLAAQVLHCRLQPLRAALARRLQLLVLVLVLLGPLGTCVD
jgi:hypothetical protein